MAFGKPTTWTDERLDRAFEEIESRLEELEGTEEPAEVENPQEKMLRDTLVAVLPGILQGIKPATPSGNGGHV